MTGQNDNEVRDQAASAAKEQALLRQIRAALPILADLSRADLLLCERAGAGRVRVLAHARPNSLSPLYPESLEGTMIPAPERAHILRALERRPWGRPVYTTSLRGSPVAREVLPIYSERNRVPAALIIDTSWLAHERQLRRSRVFRRVLQCLQGTVLRGELAGAEALSPFGEHDGIVVVDLEGRVRYVSGIAANLYRRLGFVENLVGQHISVLETADEAVVAVALKEMRCLEEESTERDLTWVRKAIPFRARSRWLPLWGRLVPGNSRPAGVILTLHDATEALRRERELKIKSAMIQEIHHRVKNNLQTIASLLRMQARRYDDPAVKHALDESVNRIMSMAVVHEFLSQNELAVINIREVSQRILSQTAAGVVDPNKQITLNLQGGSIFLPTQQATVCALVLNELVQNALEHGFDDREQGSVTVTLVDDPEQVTLLVEDDGGGLPAGFDMAAGRSLGLRIVRTLIEADLKGRFELQNMGADGLGVRATVTFPKSTLGGERPWNGQE